MQNKLEKKIVIPISNILFTKIFNILLQFSMFFSLIIINLHLILIFDIKSNCSPIGVLRNEKI